MGFSIYVGNGLFKDSFGQENSPASPSSSYSNKYYNKNQVKEEKNPIVIPRQNQIVVQGNTRLDSSVVIRDSLIDIDNTKPKDLSYAIKNLYKTGYFENVNIDGIALNSDDWVGAFKDTDGDGIGDICVGAKKWDTNSCLNGICGIFLMGVDEFNLTDTENYMQDGDIPVFMIYDQSENSFYDAKVFNLTSGFEFYASDYPWFDFTLNNQNQKDSIIDAIKISCRKITKEITGKKPVTNIKLVRI